MRRALSIVALGAVLVTAAPSCAHAPPASAYRAPVGQCLASLGTLLFEAVFGGARDK